jgi:hypothetical protein
MREQFTRMSDENACAAVTQEPKVFVPKIFKQAVESAIKEASNDVIHQRSKHINIRYHSVRHHLKKKDIQFEWVDTHHQ